jgi:hypothetical protein
LVDKLLWSYQWGGVRGVKKLDDPMMAVASFATGTSSTPPEGKSKSKIPTSVPTVELKRFEQIQKERKEKAEKAMREKKSVEDTKTAGPSSSKKDSLPSEPKAGPTKDTKTTFKPVEKSDKNPFKAVDPLNRPSFPENEALAKGSKELGNLAESTQDNMSKEERPVELTAKELAERFMSGSQPVSLDELLKTSPAFKRHLSQRLKVSAAKKRP